MLSIGGEQGFAGPTFGEVEISLQDPDSLLHIDHFVYNTQPQSADCQVEDYLLANAGKCWHGIEF